MKRSKHFFRAIFLTLVTVFLATAAHAQYRASIQGIVTDPQGETVVGATVTLQNDETGQKYTTTSAEGGVFNFNGLLPASSLSRREAKVLKQIHQGVWRSPQNRRMP